MSTKDPGEFKKNIQKNREATSNMLDFKLRGSVAKDEKEITLEEALSRFQKDTGIQFQNLMNSQEYRAKVFINGLNNTDTDEDEDKLQKMYEPLQKKLFSEQ